MYTTSSVQYENTQCVHHQQRCNIYRACEPMVGTLSIFKLILLLMLILHVLVSRLVNVHLPCNANLLHAIGDLFKLHNSVNITFRNNSSFPTKSRTSILVIFFLPTSRTVFKIGTLILQFAPGQLCTTFHQIPFILTPFFCHHS